MKAKMIARWETRGKRYWIELFRVGDEVYEFLEDGGGGGWFNCETEALAIEKILERVKSSKDIDGINLIRKI